MAKAYADLAATWAKGQPLTQVGEGERPQTWTPPTSAWYLGLGDGAKRLLAGLPEVEQTPGGGWRIQGKEFGAGVTVVLTGGFPQNPDRSWTLIAAPEPGQVSVVGNKLQHYGKYSYLVFDQGKNVGQGIWSETKSPLKVDLVSIGNAGRKEGGK
jgi:aminopeptidase N